MNRFHGTNMLYLMNSDALGDVVASLAPLKRITERFHPDDDYTIGVRTYFMPLFFEFNQECVAGGEQPIQMKDAHVMLALNDDILDPLKMHLSHYASLKFARMVFDYREISYPKLPVRPEVFEKFGMDFGKCVAIVASKRASNRFIPADELEKLADYITEKGYTPVLIGSTEIFTEMKRIPYERMDVTPETRAVDLRDQTTLIEVANIMGKCAAVVGVDNGLLHLAGMTDVPIVAGYTITTPEIRMPIRHGQLGWNCYPVVPNGTCCRFCQSRWNLYNHSFGDCKYEDHQCSKSMTAAKFIAQLERVLRSEDVAPLGDAPDTGR